MTAITRTIHKSHVALLSTLLLVSLATVGITAGFIGYMNALNVTIPASDFTKYSENDHRYVRAAHFPANGVALAGGLITFLTSLYFLIGNASSIMLGKTPRATSVALEIFFLSIGWILSVVGSALFISDIQWSSCVGDGFCGFATTTMAFGWLLVAMTTGILGLLAYYGFSNSSSDIDGHPVSVWGELTLSRSSRGAEKLELL